ncbi:MAG: TIGR03790 family protein, partial [Lentisphaerae bacterium]|nr:TIGR03790 family protein [Lentisphaerota bacterium]
MYRLLIPAAVLLLLVTPAAALGPHEIVLLVNSASADSVEVAAEYAALRQVPERNIIRLDLSPDPPVAISRERFVERIWLPVVKTIRNRRLRGQVLAWIYSAGFPTAVKAPPRMSLTGITFLANRVPAPAVVRDATYVSPLFAGPDGLWEGAHFPQSLDLYREWLGQDMPVPSMMLGYIGEYGNTKEEVLDALRNGAASDTTAPTGTVFFVTRDDVRSRCREWQFTGAVAELRALGCEAVITDQFPSGRQIIGLLSGAAWVYPGVEDAYLPGAMAEHLTSAAGNFNDGNQTKMSAWLKAGATASAGTVTEPYSRWEKFPHARFFVHYRAGCGVLESFYQSIRSPLEILLIGDPLACPWAPEATMSLHGLDDTPLSGSVTVRATIECDPMYQFRRFLILLDGE